jgi:hypothetical protein
MSGLSLLIRYLGTLLTNLASENKTNWDEHLSIMSFSYIIAYKTIRYAPYQLVYGLHPLVPTKYIMLITSGNHRDNTSVKILTNKVSKLKKLHEVRIQATKINGIQ